MGDRECSRPRPPLLSDRDLLLGVRERRTGDLLGDPLTGDLLAGDPLAGDLLGDPLTGDLLAGDPLGGDLPRGDSLPTDLLGGDPRATGERDLLGGDLPPRGELRAGDLRGDLVRERVREREGIVWRC